MQCEQRLIIARCCLRGKRAKVDIEKRIAIQQQELRLKHLLCSQQRSASAVFRRLNENLQARRPNSSTGVTLTDQMTEITSQEHNLVKSLARQLLDHEVNKDPAFHNLNERFRNSTGQLPETRSFAADQDESLLDTFRSRQSRTPNIAHPARGLELAAYHPGFGTTLAELYGRCRKSIVIERTNQPILSLRVGHKDHEAT